MKRVLCFILTSILILNTVITPEISARAQTADEAAAGARATVATETDTVDTAATRTAAMSRADKILGLEEYDEYGIGESDADIYEYQMNLTYPADYMVEAARKNLGFEGCVFILNNIFQEDATLNFSYYYELVLMSLLFEQAKDASFLDVNEVENQKEVVELSQDFWEKFGLESDVDDEIDALEKLKKLSPDDFSQQEYLDGLKNIKVLQENKEILGIILEVAEDAADVLEYAQGLQRVVDLREEIITFLGEMEKFSDNEYMIRALEDIREIYKAQQTDPDNVENIIQKKASKRYLSRMIRNMIGLGWDELVKKDPEFFGVIDVVLGCEIFTVEQLLCPEALSDSYAKMSAVWELEEAAREALLDVGEKYKQNRENVTDVTRTLAGVFDAGWNFFTVLLDADCLSTLLFTKTFYSSGYYNILHNYSGSEDYEDYSKKIKKYQDYLATWKNNISLYMEGLKPENRKVDGAVFNEYTTEIAVGDVFILDMQLFPEDASDQYVRYGIVEEEDASEQENTVEDKTVSDEQLVTENKYVKIEGNKLTALLPGTVQIEGIAGDSRKRDVMTIDIAMGGMSSKGLRFRVEDGKAIITGYEGTDTKVTVEDYIQGVGSMAMFPVTAIESFADEDGNNHTVKEIVLSPSVTEISDRAFYQCSSLEKINLENVEKVGDFAFAECSSIKDVKLAKVSEIGDAAFMQCNNLEEVALKNKNDTVIGSSVFADCSSLRKVDLSESVLKIIPQNFCSGCSKLKEVIWSENLEGIQEGGFYKCGFEEMVLPETIEFLGPSAISGCKNLKILVLPASINNMMESPLIYQNSDNTLYYMEKDSYVHNLFRNWINKGYHFYIRMMEHLSTEKTAYTISVGETITIPYRKNPILTGEVITFTSSDPSIASITPDGILTAKKPGTVVLTLISSYGQTFSGCKVTVTAGSGSGQNGSQSGAGTGSGTPGSSTNSSAPSNGDSSSGGSSSSTGQNGEGVIKAKNIKKAKKSKKIKTVTVGKPVRLKVKLNPANATEKPVWTSSKPKVATVSPDGKVTPKKKGKTKITAQIANGKKVTWKIKVKELKAKKISLNKKKATLHAGETLKLKAKLKPKGSTAKIKWKSSKKKVASVSKNGTVTARKKGKTVITAQLPNGKKAKCKITVKKAAPQNGGSTGGNKNNGNTGGSNGQNHTGGNSNNSNTPGGGTVTQPGGDTGNRPGENPGSGSGTSGDSQNPGGDSSGDENVPTKLTLATDNLTLKGRWQTITLSAEEETETSVGDELEITAEPDSFYGDSQILDAEITEGNDMQRIHWSSADETIVKVYNGGLIRGVRTGTTTVTATTTDGTTAQCQVTVEDADLQWESSDTEVAEISSVDSDGRTAHITAGEEGTADITVYSGSYQSTCHLTVSADGTDPEEPTDPTDPTDSTEPTEPTDPTDSTEPTEPTDPTDSTEPTEPTDPDDSNDPVNPDAQPISTKEGLKAIANDLDGDYILTNDIDISGENWTPIGTIEEPFKGTLDGDGHTISGLTIEGDPFTAAGEYHYGLFGKIEGSSSEEIAEISDLTLEGNITLNGSTNQVISTEELSIKRRIHTGAFAGDANGWVRFNNCKSTVAIVADIIAQAEKDAVTLYAGGITGGSNASSTIYFDKCVNEGTLNLQIHGGRSADIYAGGIIGRGVINMVAENCQNDGKVLVKAQTAETETVWQSVTAIAGGISADLLIADIIGCSNHADISCFANMASVKSMMGDYCLAGGLIGWKREGNTIQEGSNMGKTSASSPNEVITTYSGEIYAYPVG